MTEEEQMLTSIANCRRIDLYADKKILTPKEEDLFRSMLERRKQNEPLQYIIGNCEFMGLKFLVDSRVLIPRPETELLVEAVLSRTARKNREKLKILDIGTGCGNIAISLAHFLPQSEVVGVDISKSALDVARKNAELNSVSENISFLEADIFPKEKNVDKFDIIVSNPPYIKSSDLVNLPTDVKREPLTALDGGADGMDFYRSIVDMSKDILKNCGFLFFEIGDGQKNAIENLFEKSGKFEIIESLKDYSGIHRIITARYLN